MSKLLLLIVLFCFIGCTIKTEIQPPKIFKEDGTVEKIKKKIDDRLDRK